ncbi:MAG: hypothetical protein E6I70_00165 [Chloroflexi bacterium]|nr:MAG: hypothetical protein E6I70_00165 [Chloroflexota bacterium]
MASQARRIVNVVIPAAGLGRRLRPVTRGSPKEMLPLGGRPLIWHALREAKTAGFLKAFVVVSPGKQDLIKYLESNDLPLDVAAVMQSEPAGVGDAVLRAESTGTGFAMFMRRPAQLRCACVGCRLRWLIASVLPLTDVRMVCSGSGPLLRSRLQERRRPTWRFLADTSSLGPSSTHWQDFTTRSEESCS